MEHFEFLYLGNRLRYHDKTKRDFNDMIFTIFQMDFHDKISPRVFYIKSSIYTFYILFEYLNYYIWKSNSLLIKVKTLRIFFNFFYYILLQHFKFPISGNELYYFNVISLNDRIAYENRLKFISTKYTWPKSLHPSDPILITGFSGISKHP